MNTNISRFSLVYLIFIILVIFSISTYLIFIYLDRYEYALRKRTALEKIELSNSYIFNEKRYKVKIDSLYEHTYNKKVNNALPDKFNFLLEEVSNIYDMHKNDLRYKIYYQMAWCLESYSFEREILLITKKNLLMLQSSIDKCELGLMDKNTKDYDK